MEEKNETKNKFFLAAIGNRYQVYGINIQRLDAEANLPEQLLDTTCNFRVNKGIKKIIVL